MATWIIFKPQFYRCLKHGVEAEITPETRIRGRVYLALYAVFHSLLILFSVLTFTDILEIPWPHYFKPDPEEQYIGKNAIYSIWGLTICGHAYLLVRSCQRARAEIEGRPYDPDQRTSVSRQQHPQEESGVAPEDSEETSPALPSRLDRGYVYPSCSSLFAIVNEAEMAPLCREQAERLQNRESEENAPLVEHNLDDYSPSVEECELDDYSPSVEDSKLDDYSPSVEESKLDDYSPSTDEGELRTLMTTQVVTHRSRHPSSAEQSSSAPHASQAAAVYEVNSEETEV